MLLISKVEGILANHGLTGDGDEVSEPLMGRVFMGAGVPDKAYRERWDRNRTLETTQLKGSAQSLSDHGGNCRNEVGPSYNERYRQEVWQGEFYVSFVSLWSEQAVDESGAFPWVVNDGMIEFAKLFQSKARLQHRVTHPRQTNIAGPVKLAGKTPGLYRNGMRKKANRSIERSRVEINFGDSENSLQPSTAYGDSGSHSTKLLDQSREKCKLDFVRRCQAKRSHTRFWPKRWTLESRSGTSEGILNVRGEFQSTGSGDHGLAGFNEEPVTKMSAQPSQGIAQCRLTESYSGCGSRDAAFDHQRIEDRKQI